MEKKHSMKMKSLASDLDQLESFEDPDLILEQYHTPPDIAAEILHFINFEGDIQDKAILDLGCGCGILGLGCIRLGAARVVGVDIDQSAIDIAERNRTDVGVSPESISFVQCDVRELETAQLPSDVQFDVVIMNPPFGTKYDVGIDYVFVKKGLEFASVVYSLHKSSTRDMCWKRAEEWGVQVEVLNKDLPFYIKRTFKFHKKDFQSVSVDLIKFGPKI